MSVFFIVSAPRSGSTSLATICNKASNCKCLIEPHLTGRVISRNLMDGQAKKEEGLNWVKENIVPSSKKYLKSFKIYSEKDYVYGPLIPYMYEIFECKFVFIKRDGRDFVSSSVNKHEQKSGNCYLECSEKTHLSKKAHISYKINLKEGNVYDYSRPRPKPSDSLYKKWLSLSRAEMCAFYWCKINEIHLKELLKIPKDNWITVDYSSKDLLDQILIMVDFLNLTGLNKNNIQKILDEKINSLKWKNLSPGSFPYWHKWVTSDFEKFDKIAGKMMEELGYYAKTNSR